MQKLAVVSSSPHAKSKVTTQRIMLDVIIALIPALIASVYYFGLRALILTAVCVLSCVVFESISRRVMKREDTISDLSAVVTGMLLAFNLPSTLPIWMAVLGALVAIVVVKQMFGGIGDNFANPAITARIVLICSFASRMTHWTEPFTGTVASATPLKENFFEQARASSWAYLSDMFWGKIPGSLGETCAVALLLGFAYLLIRRVITPTIPLAFVGTVAAWTFFYKGGDTYFMLYQILGGGLLLGAIFMATDYTTSPTTFKGKLIFGVGCGLLTCVIRLYGNMPEGVSFAILLMNLLSPHIENLTLPKPFGRIKIKKDK